MPQQGLTLSWVRAGRRYAIDSRHVACVLPCAEMTPVSARLMLASLEGLPALVVEPEDLFSAGKTAAEQVGQPSVQQAPAVAVVIGRRGVLQCGFAADHAEFFGTQPADHVLSAQQISDFLDSL